MGSGLIDGTLLALLTSLFSPAQDPFASIMTERLQRPSIVHGFAPDAIRGSSGVRPVGITVPEMS
jgi:hypothetical protein